MLNAHLSSGTNSSRVPGRGLKLGLCASLKNQMNELSILTILTLYLRKDTFRSVEMGIRV